MKLLSIVSSILATSLVAVGGAPTAASASPNDGVRCPAGYESRFAGGALSCVKRVIDDVSNTAGGECTRDTPFSNFQRMALGQRDICVSSDIVIGSADNLADFENGRVVIKVPVGRPLPPRLQGRPVRIVGNFQLVQINPNADFIFYDQSKTLEQKVAVAKAKATIVERRALNAQSDEIELGNTTVRSTPDATGSLDRVEATIEVFALAR